MAKQQKPVVGSWYINLTGQLIKVWAISLDGGRISKVVIEYLSGSRRVIDIDKWNLLDLGIHYYNGDKQNKAEEITQ